MSFLKYVGKPYEKYNCFDLVKEFYKDQFNIDLSPYYLGDSIPSRREIETLIVSNKGNFEKVSEPKFGDIVIIALYGLECHIGVCLNHVRFLHSIRGTGSTMDSLNRYKHMIAGYYRHKAAA